VSGTHSLVTLDTGLNTLNAVAVDTSYDVFVTDLLNDQVVELPGAALPPRIPGPPKITSATAGDGTAAVSFTASQSDLNSANPITGYTVTVRRGFNVTSGPAVETVPGTTSPIDVTGLTNGTYYTVTVYASNAAGNGPESAPAVVFPDTTPGAPTNVTATNSSNGTNTATVDVTFTPPASDGGLPIRNYTAVSSPGGIIGTSGNGTPSIQVTGLTYGTSYTFTVYATNEDGNGPASDPSNAVTPVPVPSPPLVPGAAAVDIAPPQPPSAPPPPDLGAAYVSPAARR